VSWSDSREGRQQEKWRGQTVWVHTDAIVYGRPRPYHWTEQCVRSAEGASLVEICFAQASASPKLRPCELCEVEARWPTGVAAAGGSF
jgi:hypothetical protein